jgi:hypothetical protein
METPFMRSRIFLLSLAGLMGVAVSFLAEPHAPMQAAFLRPAQPGSVFPQSSKDDRIARLIRQLESDSFRLREQASHELIQLGVPAYAPLKKALAAKPSLELTRRIEDILWCVEVDAESAPAVNGLRLFLKADRQKVKPGETVTFTTRLCNRTDSDLNIQVGYSYCGNYFEQGFTFRRLDLPHREVESQCHAGFCGTGAYPLFVTVSARSVIEYATKARFGVHEHCPMGYQMGYNTLESPDGWLHRIRVHHAMQPGQTAESGRRGEGSDGRPANPHAPYWSGSIYSNEVRIEAQR